MAISEEARRNHDVNEYRLMLGGLLVGNDRQVLLSTVTQLLPFIGYPRTLNAIRVIDEGTSA